MGYRVLADAAAVAHFSFLVYVLLGGFLAWKWPRAFWPHLACAAYGLGIVVIGWTCPLTYVENWARMRAGEAGLHPGGFIDHYLTGVIYPEQHLLLVQVLVGVVVAVSWGGVVLRLVNSRSRRERSVLHR
ncbi:DUF2784 domain-containing protein [Salinactinospora qingdaonensis]